MSDEGSSVLGIEPVVVFEDFATIRTKLPEMVERVAKAMLLAADMHAAETGQHWSQTPFDILSRAAIEAMRAPTGAMEVAAILKHNHPKIVWICMIDEALK